MLDADSVFERLLREAANLVPKMSTPKLTTALKVTSTLQQKITETITSRVQQEKCFPIILDSPQQVRLNTLTCLSNDADQQMNRFVSTCDGNGSLTNQSNHLTANCSRDSGTLMSPMAGVVSSASGVTGCDAVLLPLLHGNRDVANTVTISSDIQSIGGQCPSSTCCSPVPPSSIILKSGSGDFIATTPGDMDGSTAPSPSSGHTKLNLDGVASAADQALQQLRASGLCIEMKQEPLECLNQVTIGELDAVTAAANSVNFMTTGLSPLPPLKPFLRPSNVLLSSGSTTGMVQSTPKTSHMMLTTSTTAVTTNPDVTITSPSLDASTLSTSSSKSGANNTGGPYRCRDCDKEFRILRYLEKHRRIHTGEKPYQCCYCGRQFNDWPNMNRHKRIHTGERPYRCGVCAKTFSQPAVYNEHVKRHTGERPYICLVCAKGFPRAARLAVHMRVHTGERPYPCTSCDRRFSQPHHLAAHLRVHSGDRPYPCTKCDVSFACISNLRRHRKQVHPSSPIPLDEPHSGGGTDSVLNISGDDKKPSTIQCALTDTNSTMTRLDPPSLLAAGNPGTVGTDSSVALAAAMSAGTLLTATGAALVPANLLPAGASSIPGLILTSSNSGALLAAPAQFADHHSQPHLQSTTLIAHSSDGCPAPNPSGLLTSVAGSGALVASDSLLKSVCSVAAAASSSSPASTSSTVSFVLPTVLTSTSNTDSFRPTSVAFFTTPTGEFDRSFIGGHDVPGIVVNSVNGETVYLEPLDPRVTFESGQPFTLATIPTTHTHGSATILTHPQSGAHLLSHPFQLQPGSHIAFATTNLSSGQAPGQHQLIAPTNSVVLSSNAPVGQQPSGIYTNHSPATLIFPQSGGLPQLSLSSQPQSVLQSPTTASTQVATAPSQLLHYHRSTSSCGNGGTGSLSPCPSSTTQHTTTMLVPIMHNTSINNAAAVSVSGVSESTVSAVTTTAAGWPFGTANFVALHTSHLSPSSITAMTSSSSAPTTILHDDHHQMDTTATAATLISSRPSSALSNASSLGAITVTTVTEPNL